MRNLTKRVDTGVGASRAADRNLGSGDRRQGCLDRCLHRRAIRLPLPAHKAGAVIFDCELVAGHQSIGPKSASRFFG